MVSSARPAALALPGATVNAANRLASLFHEHFELVWRLSRRLGVHPESIDDVVQEVFVIVQRRLDGIEAGKERAFVYGTTVRVAADSRRARARRREDGEGPESAAELPTPDELLDQKRARELLDDIIARLPDDTRAVFVLYELEQLTMAEIATSLELPPGTVASRLRRGREAFQARVARLEAAGKGKP